MEAKAQAKYVRCTPMKARRVVDVVRGKRAVEAVNVKATTEERLGFTGAGEGMSAYAIAGVERV